MTPYLEEHGTQIAGLADNPGGDERYYNNLIVNDGLAGYDAVTLPMFLGGNVYLNGARPSKHESDPLVLSDVDPKVQLIKKADGLYLQIDHDEFWAQQERSLVTTELLGQAKAPDLPYLNYDGAPLTIDVDHFGHRRNSGILFPGPFDELKEGRQAIKVWPKK
jgi:alpha-N-arabinofuranosidase